ncbi:MAG: GMC family oxidoreductase [Chlorogloeopsis fritschii C42_A2020_084]|uniref:GMC oxidoreductase n=1 Tax=Chlorogloeopsis fritschii TaxID=1124 RepID=UPI0019FE7084|nr:GMC oxidoreductase [Chlorogloeopsis fritschii]MBF2007947.1 GMC family oxidoreductase [Chlorogloeopsis fritschii C42_A2020_084]
MNVQAVVIGSGFGGAVAALRLGEAGIETVVLERGRRWTIEDPTQNATFATFRNPDGRAEWLNTVTKTPGYEGIAIEKYTGVLEILERGNYKFLVGCGVGGGSLAYGGILIQPPRELFEQVFPSSISYEQMDSVYFPRVHSVIGSAPIPDDVLESKYYLGLKVLEQHALKAGFPYVESTNTGLTNGINRFPMGVDWDIVREEMAGKRVPSVIAAEFWFGNNSGGKKTLDQNYLKLAEQTGSVEIRTHHLVTKVAEKPELGYEVSVDIINDRGEVIDQQTLTCQYLFMAAGVIGTCELLIKAKAKGDLPRINDTLGQGFGNDGDTYAFRTNLSEKTNPHLGGPGAIVVLNYENPIYPCVMMRAPLPRFETDFPDRNVIGSFVFAMTPHRGNFNYDPASDTVQLNFESDPKAKEAAKYLAELLSQKNGGDVPPIAAQVTGHQLGGACMGQVCDDCGRVAGHPNLYIVDGSLIPGSSTCVNPALTIAAIAERCLDRILDEDIKPL